MNDLLFLTLDEVLQLHSEALEHFGGQAGIRDLSILQSAVAMPQQGFGGAYLHPDLAAMAAAYFFHIASNHAFLDGNKRVGVRAAYMFLALNGYEVDFPLEETERIAIGVARSSVSKEQVTQFVRGLLDSTYPSRDDNSSDG